MVEYGNITFEEALKIIAELQSGKRKDLIDKIGKEMCESLGRLGYITQGSTFDENGYRVPVWKKTKKISLFDFLQKEYSEEEKQLAAALSRIEC